MATSTPVSPAKGNNQFTYKLDKTSVLVWRRALLVRYFNVLGKEENCNIAWKDFDTKNRVIVLSDEKRPFEWRQPASNLFKTTVELTINRERLCVISIFYSKFTLLVQGKNCGKWVDNEHTILSELVSNIIKNRGSYSSLEIDRKIKKLRFHPEIYDHDDSFNDTDLSESILMQTVAQAESSINENPGSPPLDTSSSKIQNAKSKSLKSNEKKDNDINKAVKSDTNIKLEQVIVDMLSEMKSVKEALHNVELKVVEKNKIIYETRDMCQSLLEKCDKIPEIQKEVTKIRDIVTKMSQTDNSKEVIQKSKIIETEVRNNSKQLTEVENIAKEVKSGVTELKHELDLINIHDNHPIIPNKDKMNENLENPERNQNAKSENKSERQMKADLWIIGSSLVKNLDGRKMYSNKITRISTLNDKTIHGATEFVKMKKVISENIMFQIGSNDVDDTGLEIGEIIENFENLIDVTKKEYPTAKIFVGELLPRFYENETYSENFETRRLQFNILLKDMCTDKELTLITNENMRESDFYDGIHLNPNGIKFYVRNLKTTINPHLNVKSPDNYVRPSLQNKNTQRQYVNKSDGNKHNSFSYGQMHSRRTNGNSPPFSYSGRTDNHINLNPRRNGYDRQTQEFMSSQNFPNSSPRHGSLQNNNGNLYQLLELILRSQNY